MDVFFLALESPLFPGALLALFFALAARALTQDHEIAFAETPRSYPRSSEPRPAPAVQPEAVERETAVAEPVVPAVMELPVRETASRGPASLEPASSLLSSLESLDLETTDLDSGAGEASATCSEPVSEPLDADLPVRWL